MPDSSQPSKSIESTFQGHSNPSPPLSVGELYHAKACEWDLEVITAKEAFDNLIHSTETHRPGLALTGYHDVFSSDRIQIIGITEMSYLQSLDPEVRARALQKTLKFHIPCVVVTSGLEICEELTRACSQNGIPLLKTTHTSSLFQSLLSAYLEHRLAEAWYFHGNMMDIHGMGVLLRGKSGIGKSECALELIERGHRLIADDIVVVRRVAKNQLVGESNHIGHYMELRGIGIIDVPLVFGVRGIRQSAPISLIIALEEWVKGKEYERLGDRIHPGTLYGCEIPEYVMPVKPGRNIALLIEVVALNLRLQQQGISAADNLEKKITDLNTEAALKRRNPLSST